MQVYEDNYIEAPFFRIQRYIYETKTLAYGKQRVKNLGRPI